MPKRKIRAALYVRESDLTLADSVTIDSAVKAVKEYCRREDYLLDVQHEYIEAVSAVYVPYFQRPRLMDMLKAAARHEFDTVVIVEVRALSRKGAGEVFLIYQELQKANVSLETINEKFSDDPIGELILSWRATYARLEREQSSLRMLRGRADRIAIGNAPNGHPKPAYGYILVDSQREVKGRYEFNHTIIYVDGEGVEWSEYKVICHIFELLKEGASLYTTAHILSEIGIPTPKGGTHWRASAIRNIIHNPIYMGQVWVNKYQRLENRKQITRPKSDWILLPEGTAPAILSVEEYDAVLRQIAENRNESVRNNKHTKQLGLLRSGYCRCMICHRTMHVEYPSLTAEMRGTTPAYRCQQRGGKTQDITYHHSTSICMSLLEQDVKSKIMEILRIPNWVRARVEELRKDAKPSVNPEDVAATVAKLQLEIDNLFDLAKHSTNDKNRERLGLLMEELEKQQREAESLLYDIEDEQEEQAKLEAEIVRFEEWFEEVKPSLSDPTYMTKAGYEELRLAVKVLGIVAFIYPQRGDWPFRCHITATIPKIMKKIHPDYVLANPLASSPVSSRFLGPSVAR